MRGRVMSLWFVAFQGSTPIGGPLVGWVMARSGAPVRGWARGAITCLLAALLGSLALRRLRARPAYAAQAAGELGALG